jgi:hypothetical protein
MSAMNGRHEGEGRISDPKKTPPEAGEHDKESESFIEARVFEMPRRVKFAP